MIRFALAALMTALALPAPVLAQATAPAKGQLEYYVILDTRAKKCSVVDKAPQVDSPTITLASDAIYPTRSEAEAAMKTLKPCLAS